MQRAELATYLDQYLDISRFRDYCPNGLQVEGRAEIRTIVSGVTASVAMLAAAVENGADAVLAHRGYFWRGEDARVVGKRRRHLAPLLELNVNLFAYHLPLDAHSEFGNNAQLARLRGFEVTGWFGEHLAQRFGLAHRLIDFDNPVGAPTEPQIRANDMMRNVFFTSRLSFRAYFVKITAFFREPAGNRPCPIRKSTKVNGVFWSPRPVWWEALRRGPWRCRWLAACCRPSARKRPVLRSRPISVSWLQAK